MSPDRLGKPVGALLILATSTPETEQTLLDDLYAAFGVKPFMGGKIGVYMGGRFRREVASLADLRVLKFRSLGLGAAGCTAGRNPRESAIRRDRRRGIPRAHRSQHAGVDRSGVARAQHLSATRATTRF
jgi:hypothetical protein